MDANDFRFSISGDKYLEKHHVLVYIEDAILQLLEHKEDNPKVNTTKFLSEYFVSVREGNHTLFREYAFIKATSHNRASFVKTFWKCYRNIGRKGDLLNIKEYHSLLCLLCADFPFPPVQKTAKIILMDDRIDTVISFSDFLYAFQVQFCFDEFLTRCAEVYKELLKTKQNSHDPVYVPTSEEATPRVHPEDENSTKPDGVDAMTFLRSLLPLCEHFESLAPPLMVLKDILSSAERVTFYGFLMALAKSERLNSAIGKIPNKGELLETTEQELSSMDLLLRRSAYQHANLDFMHNQQQKGKELHQQGTSEMDKLQPSVDAQLLPVIRTESSSHNSSGGKMSGSSSLNLQQNSNNTGNTNTTHTPISAPPTPTPASSQSAKTASQSLGGSDRTGIGTKSLPTMKSSRLQKRMLRKQVSSDSDDSDDSSDTN